MATAQYNSNVNLNGNIRLQYDDVLRIRDLFKRCEDDIKKLPTSGDAQVQFFPPNQAPYNVYIQRGNRRQLQYDSIDDLLEAAKTNDELAQVDNISISHLVSGIHLNIGNGYANMYGGHSNISVAQTCAMSIFAILTSNLKTQSRYGQRIMNWTMSLAFIVTPVVIVAYLLQYSTWWLLILLVPPLYLHHGQAVAWHIYSRFINKVSSITLISNYKTVKSKRRQKTLTTVLAVLSALGMPALAKFIYDIVVGLVSK